MAKYDDIDFTPPAGVLAEAKRAWSGATSSTVAALQSASLVHAT